MRFRTRYSVGMIVIVACCILPSIVLSLLPGVGWIIFAFVVAVAAFIAWSLTGIKYDINPDTRTLTIIQLSFFKKHINIDDITELKYSTSWLSAPASSLKRLEVKYGRRKSVLISPYCQDLFVEMLENINPNIKVDERLR